MTTLPNQLLADTMTLYIRMASNTVFASAEMSKFGRMHAHKMLTEIRKQGLKPDIIGYQML